MVQSTRSVPARPDFLILAEFPAHLLNRRQRASTRRIFVDVVRRGGAYLLVLGGEDKTIMPSGVSPAMAWNDHLGATRWIPLATFARKEDAAHAGRELAAYYYSPAKLAPVLSYVVRSLVEACKPALGRTPPALRKDRGPAAVFAPDSARPVGRIACDPAAVMRAAMLAKRRSFIVDQPENDPDVSSTDETAGLVTSSWDAHDAAAEREANALEFVESLESTRQPRPRGFWIDRTVQDCRLGEFNRTLMHRELLVKYRDLRQGNVMALRDARSQKRTAVGRQPLKTLAPKATTRAGRAERSRAAAEKIALQTMQNLLPLLANNGSLDVAKFSDLMN